MEVVECKNERCEEDFPKKSNKKFCCRKCKDRYNKMTQYYTDGEYKKDKQESALKRYYDNQAKWCVPISELSELQLEELKDKLGRDHRWFKSE